MLLDKNYDPDKEYTLEEKTLIDNKWIELCDAYFKLKNDDKSKLYLNKRNEELCLYHKIKNYTQVINLLVWIDGAKQYMSLLEAGEKVLTIYNLAVDIEPKTKINEKKSLEYNHKVMIKTLESLKTKYRIKFKEKKKVIEDSVNNSYAIVANVENVLGRSVGDISKMNVEQWTAYEVSAKSKLDQNGK